MRWLLVGVLFLSGCDAGSLSTRPTCREFIVSAGTASCKSIAAAQIGRDLGDGGRTVSAQDRLSCAVSDEFDLNLGLRAIFSVRGHEVAFRGQTPDWQAVEGECRTAVSAVLDEICAASPWRADCKRLDDRVPILGDG